MRRTAWPPAALAPTWRNSCTSSCALARSTPGPGRTASGSCPLRDFQTTASSPCGPGSCRRAAPSVAARAWQEGVSGRSSPASSPAATPTRVRVSFSARCAVCSKQARIAGQVQFFQVLQQRRSYLRGRAHCSTSRTSCNTVGNSNCRPSSSLPSLGLSGAVLWTRLSACLGNANESPSNCRSL